MYRNLWSSAVPLLLQIAECFLIRLSPCYFPPLIFLFPLSPDITGAGYGITVYADTLLRHFLTHTDRGGKSETLWGDNMKTKTRPKC